MDDWHEGEPREPRPLRLAKPPRRALVDANDWQTIIMLGARVSIVTFAALWLAFVLGLSFGMAKIAFCALAACH